LNIQYNPITLIQLYILYNPTVNMRYILHILHTHTHTRARVYVCNIKYLNKNDRIN